MGDKQKAELLCKERPFFSLQYLGFCFPLCSDFPGFSFLSQLSSKGNKKIWMKLETFGTTLRNSFWVFQIPGYASSNGRVLLSPLSRTHLEMCGCSSALTPLLLGLCFIHTTEALSAKQSKQGNENYTLKLWKRPENGWNFAPIKICLCDTNPPMFL